MLEVIKESGNFIVLLLIICIAKLIEVAVDKFKEARRRKREIDALLDYCDGKIPREEYDRVYKECANERGWV